MRFVSPKIDFFIIGAWIISGGGALRATLFFLSFLIDRNRDFDKKNNTLQQLF
jgi:hypothetical protein